jgi:hypothetical protein
MNTAPSENHRASGQLKEKAYSLLQQAVKNAHPRTIQAARILAEILDLNTAVELFHGRIFIASKMEKPHKQQFL